MRSERSRSKAPSVLLLVLGCLVAIVLSACGGGSNGGNKTEATATPSSGDSGPRVISHTKPSLKVDFAPFENADCPPENRICSAGSELYKLGCDRIRPVSEFMGGLKPSYPMAVCQYEPFHRQELADKFNTPRSEYFFNVGGPVPQLLRYVIVKDGKMQLIKNPDEFRAVFGSVDSENEALGFALGLNRLYAQYGLKLDAKYVYETNTLEDTFVKAVSDGYLVHLYDYQVFGCGPHYYYAVDVTVKRDGQTQETSRTKIYRDPKGDGLCVD